MAEIPVGMASRMLCAKGVRADGTRSAKAASIWARRCAAELMSSLYLRLIFRVTQISNASEMVQCFRKRLKILWENFSC